MQLILGEGVLAFESLSAKRAPQNRPGILQNILHISVRDGGVYAARPLENI
jgi:hypothetical protein